MWTQSAHLQDLSGERGKAEPRLAWGVLVPCPSSHTRLLRLPSWPLAVFPIEGEPLRHEALFPESAEGLRMFLLLPVRASISTV
jgi:hypothetical protein